jgi:uncharacterized protein YecT (DUF1311 family)
MKAALVLVLTLASISADAVEAGDSCSAGQRLPRGLTCFDREVYDCRSLEPSGGAGRMGYIACGAYRVNVLEQQMDTLYQELLRRASKPLGNGRDSQWVRRALQKSQEAWNRSTNADCELQDSLLGTGNASAGIAMDCRMEKVRARIATLNQLKVKGDL